MLCRPPVLSVDVAKNTVYLGDLDCSVSWYLDLVKGVHLSEFKDGLNYVDCLKDVEKIMVVSGVMAWVADLPDEEYFALCGPEFLANIDPFEFSLYERTPPSVMSKYLFGYYNSQNSNYLCPTV